MGRLDSCEFDITLVRAGTLHPCGSFVLALKTTTGGAVCLGPEKPVLFVHQPWPGRSAAIRPARIDAIEQKDVTYEKLNIDDVIHLRADFQFLH